MKQLLERDFEVHKRLDFKSIEEIVEFLKGKNINLKELDYIDKGAFGQAFYNPKSKKVIKITADDNEVDFYNNVMDRNLNESLDYLVNIHKVYNLENGVVKGIILMEKLEKIPWSIDSKLSDIYQEITEFPYLVANNDINEMGKTKTILNKIAKEEYKSQEKKQEFLKLVKALREIKKTFDSRIFNGIIELISFHNPKVARYIFEHFIGLYIEQKQFMTDYFNMILSFIDHDLLHNDIKPAHILYSPKDDRYKVIDPR